jgi:two-component system LytT family sensor kinase
VELPVPPWPTPRERAGALALATLAGLLQAVMQALPARNPLRALGAPPVLSALAQWWWWVAALPVLARIARRFPLTGGPRSFAAHAALAFATSPIPVLLTWAVTGVPLGLFLREDFLRVWMNRLDPHLVTYAAVVACLCARDVAWAAAQEEERSSRLDEQLAKAQLEVLGLQLHPHFLFNTLNAVAELAHRDREEAVRAVRDLRALLRLSFERAASRDVALGEELAFVRAYADIQRRRFRALVVRIDVDADVLAARVPHLLLQPLVENALRHGVASAGGRVGVRAWRDGRELRIEVTDDGSGQPASRPGADGLGLRNTRERLAQLVGSAHRLELLPRVEGGTCARVVLPLQVPA